MGFRLETEGTPPEWPHFRCTGDGIGEGRGWAWHEDPAKRRCFSSDRDVNAPPALVAAAIDHGAPGVGHTLSGIDRLLAVTNLRRTARDGFLRVFPDKCPVCDGNHRYRPSRLLLAVEHVHPLAIPALRSAHVPERLIREPLIIRKDDVPIPTDEAALKALLADSKEGRRVKRRLALSKNLPFYEGDPDRTRLAQIRFALAYARKVGIQVRLDTAQTSPIQEYFVI